MMKLKRLYKNWFVHNCFGHPLMYFAAILFSVELSKLIHDSTLPPKNKIDNGEEHF